MKTKKYGKDRLDPGIFYYKQPSVSFEINKSYQTVQSNGGNNSSSTLSRTRQLIRNQRSKLEVSGK